MWPQGRGEESVHPVLAMEKGHVPQVGIGISGYRDEH